MGLMPASAPTRAKKHPHTPSSGPWRPGPGRAGMEAHPALLPSWNSGLVAAVTAVSGPPHPLPRFPLLLKISCFQQASMMSDTQDQRAPAPGSFHLAGPRIPGVADDEVSPPPASQRLQEPTLAQRLCHHRALQKLAAHLCSRVTVLNSPRQPWGLQTLCLAITDKQDPA